MAWSNLACNSKPGWGGLQKQDEDRGCGIVADEFANEFADEFDESVADELAGTVKGHAN